MDKITKKEEILEGKDPKQHLKVESHLIVAKWKEEIQMLSLDSWCKMIAAQLIFKLIKGSEARKKKPKIKFWNRPILELVIAKIYLQIEVEG